MLRPADETAGSKDGRCGKEKHVPVIEKTSNGYLVKVGSIAHPMEEKHHIEWIELIDGKGARIPAVSGSGARLRKRCSASMRRR